MEPGNGRKFTKFLHSLIKAVLDNSGGPMRATHRKKGDAFSILRIGQQSAV
jgi:hypothetical protein